MDSKEEFEKYLVLSNDLIENNLPSIGLFIGIVVSTGLKYEEIKKLSWDDLLRNEYIGSTKIEKDKILDELIQKSYRKVNPKHNTQKFLLSRKKLVFTQQRINILLKAIDKNLTINYLRKIFARNFLEKFENRIYGLVALQERLGHYNLSSTARFLDEKIKAKDEKKGKCYIIADNMYPKWYKIGKADDEIVREHTLLHHAPSLTMIKIVESDNPRRLEKEIHEELKEYRAKPTRKGGKRPEWFELDNEKLDYIVKKYNFKDYE
jgi:hypothetical protein